MASSSKRRKTISKPLTEDELLMFIDDLDNEADEGSLDSDISDSDFSEKDSDDDGSVDELQQDVEVPAQNNDEEEAEIIRNVNTLVPRRRKHQLKDLDATMDKQNYDLLPPQPDEIHTYTPKSKGKSYTWKKQFAVTGRRGRENMIHNHPGPSRLTAGADTPLKLFDLFFTVEMLTLIVRYTNTKIQEFINAHPNVRESSKYSHCKETDIIEIRALIGLIYLRGALHLTFLHVKRLFQQRSSNTIFMTTMSQNRFAFLLGMIEFDDHQSRAARWRVDRFTAIRDIFNMFNKRCALLRIPTEFLSIDETLYPYRGKIQIRQYNPNKPAKYGLLYRSLSDAKLPYTYFTLPYAGKPNEVTEDSYYVTGTDNYTIYLVEGMSKFCDIRGRNISMDRYFTSMTIAEYLLSKEITLVGTLRSDRKGIPKELKETKERETPSIVYVYCTEEKSLMISYFVKTKSGSKNVLVLSTMHKEVLVTKDDRKKPHVICFYDRTKGGVDVMDMMAGTYSCRYKSRRWTANAFAYILDTVRTNSTTLFREIKPEEKISSFDFLWTLGEQLITPHVQRRYINSHGLQVNIINAMKLFLGQDVEQPAALEAPSDRKRCFYCIEQLKGKPHYKEQKNKLGKSKHCCPSCQRTVCTKHASFVCNECIEKFHK